LQLVKLRAIMMEIELFWLPLTFIIEQVDLNKFSTEEKTHQHTIYKDN